MNTNFEYMYQIRKIIKFLKMPNIGDLELITLKKCRDDLILDYLKKISIDCAHDVVEDIGYYKIKGKEVWLTDKEESDFRVIKCLDCGRDIYLIKNDTPTWDTKILENNFKIKEENKQKVKSNNHS